MGLTHALKQKANPKKAKIYQRFFKTGKGEYGEGDIFLGLTVPETRKIAKQFEDLSLKEIQKHLKSKYHEERLAALLILVHNYQKHPVERKNIFDFYLANTKYVNNWDLVDLTAHKIVGNFLHHFGKDYSEYKILLTNLAKSSSLWERRISIISTAYFISQNDFSETLFISKLLMKDKHDLIHKAVGWMLREVGKKDLAVLEKFLKKHYKNMPRTMLRYAIERFPEEKRQRYLKGEI